MLEMLKVAAERLYDEDMKDEVKTEAVYYIENSEEDFDEGELDALVDKLFAAVEEVIAKLEG